ncbi:hypothetical protein GALMADRAFT_135420 [Galerina marginata CBS 339.88]|uniref:Cytochrome P450 n=1 Tax=Galerina marginata (strain CBS 339.88) TaxID=685588 RepID=A0A067TQ66_GALM3|nr:hypothetical protein GALMADRAFT_135420 [Galerina marginata CBS 339.88]
MFLPVVAAAILLPILVALAILCRYRSAVFQSRSKSLTYHHLILEIRDTLHPHAACIQELLAERADANQRLVRVMHITNTFVSSNPQVHDRFVTHARLLLTSAQRRGWADFQAIAVEAVQWQLSKANTPLSQQQSFDSFIQNITLVVVLVGILQIETPIQSLCHKDVTVVANSITTLWALSKKPGPIPPTIFKELTTCLRRLVVDEEKFPNPLDFVIPAWETLWRVVATTIAYTYSDEEMKKTFEEFNVCPSDRAFLGTGEDISVKGIVNEAMRLRPPSKHIGRSKSRLWCPRFLECWIWSGITRVKTYADVERLLRCDIWGPNSEDFMPTRHHPRHILREQMEALRFIFGYGPLRCIASSWAPMAVGVISGAVLDQIESSGYKLERGPVIGGRAGWSGWVIKRQKTE